MCVDNSQKAVVAIIQKANKFLVVKRSDYVETGKGYWCSVSGRIEKNETQQEAIEREVTEEVGLEVRAIRRVCEIPSHDNRFQLIFWTTKIISGDAIINSNEATDIKWVTLEEMRGLKPVFEEDIQIFEAISNPKVE